MKYPTSYCSIGVLCVIISFLPVSCTSAPDIVGRWKAVGEPGILEFHRDGSFELIDNMGAVLKGNYVSGKSGNVKLVITHSDIMRKTVQPVDKQESIDGKLSVQGNELTFTSPDGGEVLKYKR